MTKLLCDPYAAPADYDELFRNYFPWLRALAVARGVAVEFSEDVTMEILCRFMESDSLQRFTPDMEYEAYGKTHRSKFSTFISRYFSLAVMGQREKVQRTHLGSQELPDADVLSVVAPQLVRTDIDHLELWSGALQNLLYSELTPRSSETLTAILLLLEEDEDVNGPTVNRFFEYHGNSSIYKRLTELRTEAAEILRKHDYAG